MAKPKDDKPLSDSDQVLVEAIMRFPYRGRPYFPHQQFVVGSRAEAMGLVDAKAVRVIGPAPAGYQRADMQAADRPER